MKLVRGPRAHHEARRKPGALSEFRERWRSLAGSGEHDGGERVHAVPKTGRRYRRVENSGNVVEQLREQAHESYTLEGTLGVILDELVGARVAERQHRSRE